MLLVPASSRVNPLPQVQCLPQGIRNPCGSGGSAPRLAPRTRAKPVPSTAGLLRGENRLHTDHAVICAMFSGCGKSSRHGVPVLSIALRRTMKTLMQATSETLASFPRPRSASYRALSVGLCFTATRQAMYSARLTSNRPPEIKRLPTDFPLS